ncbi:hypothetical protein F5050DRAFT_1780604 [Lentinula boryana]|uniref:Uncharacterized protein n=1 Tax=Lentinula boryana TaxID=40481 RepID=A0ABQ8Q4Z3_9AGAR|nr:hypothetical protein F5050DRAFT_1780604 [Lentinula boryana]
MAEYGLGAIIFYEIPFKSSSELENTDNDKNSSPQCNDQWTLESVFGDGDPGSETGMNVEELLEGIDARIVYVPLYACTSFVTGQVMNSFIRRLDSEGRNMDPLCVPGGFGFGVDSKGFNRFDRGSECHPPHISLTSTSEGLRNSNLCDFLPFQLAARFLANLPSSAGLTEKEHESTLPILRKAPTVEPASNIVEEQWELDWVDAELRGDSSRPAAAHQVEVADNNIPLQETYEEVEEGEQSFVTALDSFVSDDFQHVPILEGKSQTRGYPLYPPDSVLLKLPDNTFTPTIATLTNSGLDTECEHNFNSALVSITNLVPIDHTVTESRRPNEYMKSEETKLCSKSTYSFAVLDHDLVRSNNSLTFNISNDDSPSFSTASDLVSVRRSIPLEHTNEHIYSTKNSPTTGLVLPFSPPVSTLAPFQLLPSIALDISPISRIPDLTSDGAPQACLADQAFEERSSHRSRSVPLLRSQSLSSNRNLDLKRPLPASSFAGDKKDRRIRKMSRRSEGSSGG